jgi:flagellar protein FliO/FliZ
MSTSDAFSGALQMLTALGVVLGGLLLLFWFVKRYLKKDLGNSNKQFIRVIANQYVGIKKNIALIQVPGSVLVVGLTNDNISLLTKIEDQGILDQLQPESSVTEPSFSDQLQRLTAKFRSAGTND